MKNVLVKPHITEKSTALSQKGRYVFVVKRDANKIDIKKEVEKMYGVSVASVNTMIRPGKLKQRYTKRGTAKGIAGGMKKAVVTLTAGDSIDFYANI
mgnify:FL=1